MTGRSRGSPVALRDPYPVYEYNGLVGFQDTTGRTPVSAAITPGEKTVLIFVVGQSMESNDRPSTYAPVNASKVQQLHWYPARHRCAARDRAMPRRARLGRQLLDRVRRRDHQPRFQMAARDPRERQPQRRRLAVLEPAHRACDGHAGQIFPVSRDRRAARSSGRPAQCERRPRRHRRVDRRPVRSRTQHQRHPARGQLLCDAGQHRSGGAFVPRGSSARAPSSKARSRPTFRMRRWVSSAFRTSAMPARTSMPTRARPIGGTT
jgi:hypothetical protein